MASCGLTLPVRARHTYARRTGRWLPGAAARVFIACGGPGPARKRDAGVGGEEKAGRRRPPARPPAVLSLLSMPSVGINTALMGRCCYDACLQSGL